MNRILSFALLAVVAIALLGIIPQSEAQSGLVWTADFYNSNNLSGTAVRQTFNNVNFNWGSGAPVNGVAADNWSARFSAIAHFNAGTYRFTVNADDAVRVFVHGNPIIDTWNSPRPGQSLTADVTLTNADAGVTVEYREAIGNAYLSLSWQQTSGNTTPPQSTIPTGSWLGEYWNNRTMSNNPNVVITESSPTHDWGSGAPVNGVAADNFSARWSSYQYFTAGSYRLTLTVDDGVRVTINGTRVLDEWHGSPTIATYTRDVQLFTGNNLIVIDYYEDTGIAKIQYSLVPASSVPPTQAPVNSIAYVTINTSRLNVRANPFIGDNVITKVSRSENYPVLGRNADSSWWFIQVGANTGWVSGSYVLPFNTQNVPVMNSSVEVPNTPTSGTGYILRATANLNMRSGAGTSFSRVNILPLNANAEIMARNANNTWWLVRYGSTTAWVSGAYVVVPSGMDYNRIPVR